MKSLFFADWCTLKDSLRRYLLVSVIICASICASTVVDATSATALANEVQQTCILLTGTTTAMMCFYGLFASDERIGWEAVRLSMPPTRGQVVLARYLFLVALLAGLALGCTTLGVVASAVVTGIAYGMPVLGVSTDALLAAFGCVLIVLAYSALGMPIFFWKGYAKGRFAFTLPLVLIPLTTIPSVRDGISSLTVDPQVVMAAGIPIVAVLFAGSFLLSQPLYARRDF